MVLALIAGLGEERGWRGFALPRLETRLAPLLATALLGFVWAMWHLPLVCVDPRFPHGFTSIAPQILLALLTMLTIFFYTWVYNRTQSVLLCMLLHGSFNAAIGLLPASFEVLQGGTYVALLVVQVATLLLAVAVLAVATGGRLGYAAAPWRTPTDRLEGLSGFDNSSSVPIALEDLGAYRRRALGDRGTYDPARRSGERLARHGRRRVGWPRWGPTASRASRGDRSRA
jgi:hypothetical protein